MSKHIARNSLSGKKVMIKKPIWISCTDEEETLPQLPLPEEKAWWRQQLKQAPPGHLGAHSVEMKANGYLLDEPFNYGMRKEIDEEQVQKKRKLETPQDTKPPKVSKGEGEISKSNTIPTSKE